MRRVAYEPMLDGNVLWVYNDGTEVVLPRGMYPHSMVDRVFCFDLRTWTCDESAVVDVKVQHAWVGNLEQLAATKLEPAAATRLRELRSRVTAHMAACRVVGLSELPLREQVPTPLLLEYHGARARTILALAEVGGIVPPRLMELQRLAGLFGRMERSGIHVDRSRSNEDDGWSMRYRAHLVGDYLHPRYTPFGTFTGRFGVEPGSFNPMGLPHGDARKPITSRFPGGRIVVYDYNAMDVRTLMNILDTKSGPDLDLGDDLHARTADFLGCSREEAKAYTYVQVYGGSRLPPDPEQASKLRSLFSGVKELRSELRRLADAGKPFLSSGLRVELDPNWHDGKLVAIVVQTASSKAFERNLVRIEKEMGTVLRSRLIFTVHDEMVFDVHPDETVLLDGIVRRMIREANDGTVPYVVRRKEGENYGEVG